MNDLIHRLLDETSREVSARQRLPEATYRLQFHAGFTFRDALSITSYLGELGVTHAYASPYLKARPGSLHGYDIVDHRQFNPEIGSEEDYNAWAAALHEHGLGQVLDIVPNHMGVGTNDNPWWNDVLENGPASPCSGYFDIAWHASPRPELWGRVLLPVLGAPYGKALEAQELRLAYGDGAFTVHYFGHRFPVDPRSYALILTEGPAVWQDTVLLLPGLDPGVRLRNVFTGEVVACAEWEGFASFPVALFEGLHSEPEA
ncbi:MAG: hypothetical protein L0Z62_32885 [Gemmataceae bacterium]|nr:hypothetical protein [Gemmataceae bacterium]